MAGGAVVGGIEPVSHSARYVAVGIVACPAGTVRGCITCIGGIILVHAIMNAQVEGCDVDVVV